MAKNKSNHDLPVYITKAKELCQNKFFDEALSLINEGMGLFPDNSDLYYTRSYVYLESKQLDKALEDIDRAIKHDPDCSQYYYFRGFIRAKSDKYLNQAIDDFTKAIELGGDKEKAYMERIRTYLSMKEYDKAISDVNYLIKNHPDNEEYPLMKTMVYFMAGRLNERGDGFQNIDVTNLFGNNSNETEN